MVERVATWQIVPHEERRVVAERRRWRHRRQALTGWVLALLVLGPLVALGAINGALSFPVVSLFIVSFVAFGLFAHRRSRWAINEGADYRRALAKEHGAVDGWTVEITIFQGAAPTGYDHGVVWVQDGQLFFVGARTSFGLFASEVTPNAKARFAAEREADSLELPLCASTPAGSVTLDLRPLAQDRAGVARLGWAVRAWLAQGTKGHGQLPPLALGPESPTPSDLLSQAVGVSMLWAVGLPFVLGLAALCAATWWSIPIVVPLLIWVLCFLWRSFGTPASHWRSWRDRRRLR